MHIYHEECVLDDISVLYKLTFYRQGVRGPGHVSAIYSEIRGLHHVICLNVQRGDVSI